MATILENAQLALREIGVSSIPNSLLNGSTDANQVLALVYAESRFLRSYKIFPNQKRSHSITLEAGRTKYPLPIDYHTILFVTMWDNDNRWPMVGPLNDTDFRNLTLGYVSPGIRKSYRIVGPDGSQETQGGQIEIYPTPAGGEVISFEYQSKNLFRPPYWASSTTYLSTTPDYVSSNGKNYVCTVSGVSGTTSITSAGVDGTVTWAAYNTPIETVLQNGFYSVFDDDIIISGIKWRYEASKNVQFDMDPQFGIPKLHKQLIDNSVGRFSGTYKSSLEGSGYVLPVASIPDGGWSV